MRDGREQQNCVDALWQFALEEYGRPEVRALCLKLQDDFGCDVNILLAAAYCGRRGQAWTVEAVESLQRAFAGHRERFILPLREMRRQARVGCPDDVYQALKAAELTMERWQLQELARRLESSDGESSEVCRVVDNLRVYGANFAPAARLQLEALGAMLAAK